MTQEKPALDRFAEIALREHPLPKEGMEEALPIPFEKRYFGQGTTSVNQVNELSFAEQLAEFHTALSNMRQKYQPFLSNCAPVSDWVRTASELNKFQFRYHSDQDVPFSRVLAGDGYWEQVTVPDFRGPTKEKGKWTGYYRTGFHYPQVEKGKRLFLIFKGVDYKAAVYVNHKWVGSHEGFFAPFEVDITDVLQEDNTLVVEVHNDYPMMGVDGTRLDGDKLYAATGPGWDDPVYGWHHCPSGAGIYNKVILEERSEVFVQDVFIKPNIDDRSFEAWIDLMNCTDQVIQDFDVQLDVFAQNFTGVGIPDTRMHVDYAGPGMNFYRFNIPFSDFQLWELDQPYLYTLRVSLLLNNCVEDRKDRSFGMRKFQMDEETVPKGTLLFNNRPILLRGANEMGHLQQCVMKNDHEQLIDDILIAKIANLNFYRITQRPVQEEIYDYMDRLGMLNQCDLPTFGYIRRNQFNEAVRQAAEMERLVRSHPSVIMVSLINEPSRPAKRGKGHRHLYRDELEAFFSAARHAIYIENPDRVVKNAEGDYDPPTSAGLSDFHCYTMWYTNHMIPFGKMYKGFLPSLKTDWKTGCGEYGAEGLDHLAVMLSYYPEEWLPHQLEEQWMPDAIIDAQTFGLHGDWYPEQQRIVEWIQESQRFQAFAARLMTDWIRRRSDRIVSSAIHLLIDAWPSGWMKTLVGVDRIPKPAFFTYQKCLEPVRVNLRCDRWKVYAGEQIEVEAWLLNDTAVDLCNCKVRVTFRDEVNDLCSYEIGSDAVKVMPSYAGTIPLSIPDVQDRTMLFLDACLLDNRGNVLNQERFDIEAFVNRPDCSRSRIAYLGAKAEAIGRTLSLHGSSYTACSESFDTILISSQEQFQVHSLAIVERIRQGSRAIFLADEAGNFQWEVGGIEVTTAALPALYVLFHDEQNDVSFCFNQLTHQIDPIADSFLVGDELTPLLYTYRKPSRSEQPGKRKQKLAVIGSRVFGDGDMVFVNVLLDGRIGCNPTLDRILQNLMERVNP